MEREKKRRGSNSSVPVSPTAGSRKGRKERGPSIISKTESARNYWGGPSDWESREEGEKERRGSNSWAAADVRRGGKKKRPILKSFILFSVIEKNEEGSSIVQREERERTQGQVELLTQRGKRREKNETLLHLSANNGYPKGRFASEKWGKNSRIAVVTWRDRGEGDCPPSISYSDREQCTSRSCLV